MNRYIKNIDILKLAGKRRVLGVDITDRRVRVVELESRGNPFNKFRSHFRAITSFCAEFNPDESLAVRANKLRDILRQKAIRTKLAVSSIQSLGVKSITTEIPSNVTNLSEWISEHSERLLKVPISSRDITFEYEILGKSENSRSVEVTFVRNSDLAEHKRFFKEAGLELSSLGAARRDSQNALWGEMTSASPGSIVFAHFQEGTLSVSRFQERRCMQRRTIVCESADILNVLSDERASDFEAGSKIILAGEQIEVEESRELTILKPFGLGSEYTLAAGLAIKGFLPELSPVNFLDRQERAQVEKKVYGSLLQRAVIAYGALIIILLLIPSVVSSYLESKSEAIDNEFLAQGPSYAEVAALEQRVNGLKKELASSYSRRSNLARVLHEIAAATPQGIWLSKLRYARSDSRKTILSISGFSKDGDIVAEYIKNLEANHLCSKVELVRSGSLLQAGSVLPVKNLSPSTIAFDINTELNQ